MEAAHTQYWSGHVMFMCIYYVFHEKKLSLCIDINWCLEINYLIWNDNIILLMKKIYFLYYQ